MLHCLIIEDEPIAQKIVKGYIEDTPDLVLSGICANAMQAIGLLQEMEIDLLFLDIEMPKLSGLAFLKTLKHPPQTIITTAYREFAVEGFELNVTDYLLKPFSFERFLTAVNKVIKFKDAETLRTSNTQSKQEDFTYFRSDRKNIKVYYDEIMFIKSLSNYVQIFLAKGQKIVVYEKLSNLQKSLPSSLFVRIHRSYIVSVPKITKYNQEMVEVNGQEYGIGPAFRDNFLKLMAKP